jgi:hypothetical protein
MKSYNRKPTLIRRYTDVTSLIHILSNKEITLLDPNYWEDKNDAEFMKIYKEKNSIQSLLALCFTVTGETHHHWEVFASGNSGVCIRFHGKKLIQDIESMQKKSKSCESFLHDKVSYKTIRSIEKINLYTADLPFTKRAPFRYEKEYRIIFTSQDNKYESYPMKINLDSIKEIVLSPWIHDSLAETLKILLKSIDGCKNIKVFKTTLNRNETWIEAGREAK